MIKHGRSDHLAAPTMTAALTARYDGHLMGYGVIGSTTDSGSVGLGSSPGTPANVLALARPRRRASRQTTLCADANPHTVAASADTPARRSPPSGHYPRPSHRRRTEGSGAHGARNRRRQSHQPGSEMTILRSSTVVGRPCRSSFYSCRSAYCGDRWVGASSRGDRHG